MNVTSDDTMAICPSQLKKAPSINYFKNYCKLMLRGIG